MNKLIRFTKKINDENIEKAKRKHLNYERISKLKANKKVNNNNIGISKINLYIIFVFFSNNI